MKIPDNVTDNIQILGIPFLPIYLIRGEKHAIIDGGIRALYPHLMRQMILLDVDTSKIAYHILLHTHVDHVGLAPVLKGTLKDIITLSSEHAKPYLKKLENSKYLQEMEKRMASILKLNMKESDIPHSPNKISIDAFLKNDDIIELGNGVSIEIIETPGHSSCSLSAYIRRDKAMLVSDSSGMIISSKMNFPTVFGSFDKFIESQSKLTKYDVDCILFGHSGILAGKESRGFFKNSCEETIKIKDMLQDGLNKKKTSKQIVSELSNIYYKGAIRELPRDFFDGSVKAMINMLKRPREQIPPSLNRY